ncbi:MAG: hypothetical protein ACP5QU_01870 [Anaerolineae bacterium]
MQGRVFSARRLIVWLTNPISSLIAGTLADFWLGPAARADSWLTAFSWLVGSGREAGMSLLLVFANKQRRVGKHGAVFGCAFQCGLLMAVIFWEPAA